MAHQMLQQRQSRERDSKDGSSAAARQPSTFEPQQESNNLAQMVESILSTSNTPRDVVSQPVTPKTTDQPGSLADSLDRDRAAPPANYGYGYGGLRSSAAGLPGDDSRNASLNTKTAAAAAAAAMAAAAASHNGPQASQMNQRTSPAAASADIETLDAEHALELELLGLDPTSATTLPDDLRRQIDERARLLAQATTAATSATPDALGGRRIRLSVTQGVGKQQPSTPPAGGGGDRALTPPIMALADMKGLSVEPPAAADTSYSVMTVGVPNPSRRRSSLDGVSPAGGVNTQTSLQASVLELLHPGPNPGASFNSGRNTPGLDHSAHEYERPGTSGGAGGVSSSGPLASSGRAAKSLAGPGAPAPTASPPRARPRTAAAPPAQPARRTGGNSGGGGSPGRSLGYSQNENSDSWLFSGDAMYDRQTKWRRRLEEDWARKRDQERTQQSSECTFRPNINPNSRKMVTEGIRYPEEKWLKNASYVAPPRPQSPGPGPRSPARSPRPPVRTQRSPGRESTRSSGSARGGRTASGALTARRANDRSSIDTSALSEAESFHNAARALEEMNLEGADRTTVACLRLYAQALNKKGRDSVKKEVAEAQVRDSFYSEYSEIMQATRGKNSQVASRWRQTTRATSPPPPGLYDSHSFRPDTNTSRKSYKMLRKVEAAVAGMREAAARLDEPGVSDEYAQILGDLTKDPLGSSRKLERAEAEALRRTGGAGGAAGVQPATPGKPRTLSPGRAGSPGPNLRSHYIPDALSGYALDDLTETLTRTMALVSPRGSGSGDEYLREVDLDAPSDFNAFLDRQYKYLAYQESRRQQREEEIYRRNPPQIDENSRRILEQKKKRGVAEGVSAPIPEEEEEGPRGGSNLRSRPLDLGDSQGTALTATARQRASSVQPRASSPGPDMRRGPGYENCTFRPQILRQSQKLPSRPITDLAYNDRRKVENKIEMLREKLKEKEQAELVFRPRTNKTVPRNVINADHVNAKLGLSKDLDGYMNWAMQKLEDFETWRARELEKRIMEELKECTHTPTTVAPPDYVLRLARSRAARQADGVPDPNASSDVFDFLWR